MSTALSLTNFQTMSYEELARLTGQETSANTNYLPTLSINRHPDDEDGNVLPVGEYQTRHPEYGTVFSKVNRTKGKSQVKFRPYLQVFRYALYDTKVQKYTNRSVLFVDFMGDAPDEKGGNKCGKIPKKSLEGAPAAVVEAQKAIKCMRILYGTVSFTGTTLDGTEVEVVDLPVVWQMGGSAFMSADDALKSLKAGKRSMLFHNLILGQPKREVNGSTVYYVPVIDVDTKVSLPFGPDNLALIEQFKELVKVENERVMEKFRNAEKGLKTVQDSEDEKHFGTVIDQLDDDFGDNTILGAG